MLGTLSPVISADKTRGFAPLTVSFVDESVGPVTGWTWDFGDEEASRLRHPAHKYAASGSYDVTLTVSGPGGPVAVTWPDYITVELEPDFVSSDFDQDDDVDLDDYGVLQACMGQVHPTGSCTDADLNGDTLVDQQDLGTFLECFSGAGVPADTACEL